MIANLQRKKKDNRNKPLGHADNEIIRDKC